MIPPIKADTTKQQTWVEKFKQMILGKVVPMACLLTSDRADGASGQTLAMRDDEAILFSPPRPVLSVHFGEGWMFDEITEHAIPTLKSLFKPLEVSVVVLSSDPF